MVKNPAEAMEKELARFQFKGAGIRKTDAEHFDIMAGEFPSYQVSADNFKGTEQDALELGRAARDERLVITTSGQIARAMGTLGDGSGYLVDASGRPINRNVTAPITPMKRKASDW